MNNIGQAVKKVDHYEKVSGSAKYVGDYRFENMLYAAMLRSTVAHAKIKSITYPEMKDSYVVVDAGDITTPNYLRNKEDGQQILADSEVNYIGEGISIICGPNEKQVHKYIEETVVEYEELPAVCSVEEADEIQVEYSFKKADVEDSFEKADKIYDETFHSGYQEQMYLETNGMIAIWKDNRMTIYGSMQNPYYIKNELAAVFHFEPEQVQVIQAVTGGAFGGKEDYPSLIACQAAVASRKTKRPVRFILERKEDVYDSPKRHPADLRYQVALDKENRITGMKIDVTFDGGAYQTVSATVMQRCLITSTGVYDIPSLKVHGKVMKTNKVPTGAFRGFGAPQSHYAVEVLMNHVAEFVREDPLEFKLKHLVVQGSSTATSGLYKYPVIMPQMIEKACELSGYKEKWLAYEAYKNQTGRYKKGIGMGLSIHGCGFTGSAEKDFLKSVASVKKYKNNKVEILASSTDMGQGVKTTYAKIVAEALELPLEDIIIVNPDTDRVPNSGPTVASRSIMIVGNLIKKAAEELKENWIDGEEQTVVKHYVHPSDMIPWNLETFTGDPYPTYSWGVNVIEVELDTLTGETSIIGGCGVYDVGKVIDDVIMQGQIEGGMLQGIGYASMEKMETVKGRIAQGSFTDYMVPTSMDTVDFQTCTMDNLYENGPFGAKGAGELTVHGSAPAYVQAIEQASGSEFSAIPITPERVLEVMK
ncbi:MAG: xanthine dehydrogenase family protein molybdopterin-binding subunit [Candidatus Metalachnospira sp.]|nr:xanthine dehydrogenase family protein molybdopterin-binding subunit [Candidatus Metalachnospira sp.]